MDGRGGTDMAMFQNSFELLIDLGEGTAVEDRGSDTLKNFEDIIGSSFADTIIGDDGRNSIWGGRGTDSLIGAGGDDVLIGERGNDSVNGAVGTDTCDAETEIDCELDPAAAFYSRDRGELDAVPARRTSELRTNGNDGSGVEQRTFGLFAFFPDWQLVAPSAAE